MFFQQDSCLSTIKEAVHCVNRSILPDPIPPEPGFIWIVSFIEQIFPIVAIWIGSKIEVHSLPDWRLEMNQSLDPEFQRLPTLFLGHGSPMNAIEDNSYTRALQALGKRIPRPKTIHDFGGFPKELYQIEYPAPGLPSLAPKLQSLLGELPIGLDEDTWGLDHGAWAVLRHLYPGADIPVVQLSLDLTRGPEFHFEFGERLRPLRDEGVLMIGSGNLVHNLRALNWNPDSPPHPLALEFDHRMVKAIRERDLEFLTRDYLNSTAGRFAAPTPEHYLPFLYAFGACAPGEKTQMLHEGFQNSSISMRCVQFGE